jgi:hypothetical protein
MPRLSDYGSFDTAYDSMKYSVSDAAKVVGKSRRTVNLDIRNGKLTVQKDDQGKPFIELVELERVYDRVN